jgi:hypothetical protein
MGFAAGGAAAPTPTPVDATPTPAGASPKRQRYYVEIDGHDFPVASAQEAVELLQRARALAERQAEVKAKSVEKRLRKRPEVPAVALKPPVISVPAELREASAPLLADIERLYARASVEMELRLLLEKQRQAEDDDEEVLLLS